MLSIERVQSVLDRVRPFLQADGGDIELLTVNGNSADVRLTGMFGYAADEVIGRSIRIIIPPDRQSEEDMYKLDGQLETINPHVGHHVEITGTREPSATGAKPPSATAVNPSAANAPTIKVMSMRMLSETCAR